MRELTGQERAILLLEHLEPRMTEVRRMTLARDRFDMSVTRYCQVLNRLLDEPAALASFPVVVNRLRRMREIQRERHR